MESQLVTFFNLVFFVFCKFFSRNKRFTRDLHKSETSLIVKFYLNFFYVSFVLCWPKYC